MNLHSIENILINVAYDDISKPNLSNLDIHPKWVLDTKTDIRKYLVWTQFEKYWGNKLQTFKVASVDEHNKLNNKYIYPITLYSTDLFQKYKTIDLNDNIVSAVKYKKARIVFLYTTEGDWGTNQYHFEWIDNLVEKYNFNLDDVLVLTTNLIAHENYKGNKFRIIPYNFFINDLEFIQIDKIDKHSIKQFENGYIKYIKNNKLNKKTKHFVCFNGIPRLNRLLMFGTIKTNNTLNNTTILSLRNHQSNDKNAFYEEIIKECKNEVIIEFFKNYDSSINYSYDTNDWNKIYSWGNFLNEDAHMNTFINIVTETMWNKETIFLTEKIYKPIYLCQPFILFGNPNSLKKLKEYGFKTFDKWWDESYDSELDLNLRLEKITKVLEEIVSWDFDKCYQITNEMEEVLIHNYNQLLSTDELCKVYSLLQTDMRVIKKSII